MIIVCMKQPAKGVWSGIRPGVSVLPLSYLQQNITQFKSNNKTDSVIPKEATIAAIHFAMNSNLFLPLPYVRISGLGRRISIWRAGSSAVFKI